MRPVLVSLSVLLLLGVEVATARADPDVSLASSASYYVQVQAGDVEVAQGSAFALEVSQSDLSACGASVTLKPRRVVLTAYHVIRGGESLTLRSGRDPTQAISVSKALAVDVSRDVAMLVPDVLPSDVFRLPAPGQKARIGDSIGITGNPDKLLHQFDDGTVTHNELESDAYPAYFGAGRAHFTVVLTNATALPGSSGAPLFRRSDLKLLGLVVSLVGGTSFRTAAVASSDFFCKLARKATEQSVAQALAAARAQESAADKTYYESSVFEKVSQDVELSLLLVQVHLRGRPIRDAIVSAVITSSRSAGVLHRLTSASGTDASGFVQLSIPRIEGASRIRISAQKVGYSTHGTEVDIDAPSANVAMCNTALTEIVSFRAEPSIVELASPKGWVRLVCQRRKPCAGPTYEQVEWFAAPSHLGWATLAPSRGHLDQGPEQLAVDCFGPRCAEVETSTQGEILFRTTIAGKPTSTKLDVRLGRYPKIVLEGYVLEKESHVPPSQDFVVVTAKHRGVPLRSEVMNGESGYFRFFFGPELEGQTVEIEAVGQEYKSCNGVIPVVVKRGLPLDPLCVEHK